MTRLNNNDEMDIMMVVLSLNETMIIRKIIQQFNRSDFVNRNKFRKISNKKLIKK
jgi:hypothetical protein